MRAELQHKIDNAIKMMQAFAKDAVDEIREQKGLYKLNI